MAKTGVYPVYENVFKINTNGRGEGELTSIAEMETFEVTIDGITVEWSPLEASGWMRRMVTGKSLTIKLTGKRHVGDEGNDYLAGLAWSTGADCNSQLEWTMPSGAKLKYDCVVNVVNPCVCESRDVAPLEVELLSDGKPTFTPASAV